MKTKDRTPADIARRTARTAGRAAQDAMKAGTTYPPLLADKPTRKPRAPLVSPATIAALAQQGVELDPDGRLYVGKLSRTSYGPLTVLDIIGQAQPRPVAVKSPPRLAIVRCMPCSVCGKGRSFYESLQRVADAGDWKAGAQSEANHHPAKGRGGGGSDYLVHPACTACHKLITDNVVLKIDVRGQPGHCNCVDGGMAGKMGSCYHCDGQRFEFPRAVPHEKMWEAVADTSRLIDLAIREGKLQTATLIACAVAAVANDME